MRERGMETAGAGLDAANGPGRTDQTAAAPGGSTQAPVAGSPAPTGRSGRHVEPIGAGGSEGAGGGAGGPGALAESAVLTAAEIQRLIPHRWPFLLVDRIVAYEPERGRIVGRKAVSASEWFFQGHFPSLPVMPGVLQVEALAQTMEVYVAQQEGFGDRIGLFAGIEECRFKRLVTPGDTLTLEVTMDKLGRRFGRGRGVATVDGEVACEALLSFIIPGEGVLR